MSRMDTMMPSSAPAPERAPAPSRGPGLLRRSLGQSRMRIGLLLSTLIVMVAVLGPLLAPHGAGELVGAPYQAPSRALPLGTDYLGEDVLSRVLLGGWTVLWMSLAATVFGVGAGTVVGLLAGYSRSALDDVLMRIMDVFLAFPVMVLVLLFISMIGPKGWVIVIVVGLAWMPQVARVVRGATVEVVAREYVQSAEALGAPRRQILAREVLPNIATPLMVEFGLRLTWSIGLIAAISFLGQGLQPPAADWGLMIKQNRQGLTLQPWGVVMPVLLIALFTVGTNLMTEGISRTVARVTPREGTA